MTYTSGTKSFGIYAPTDTTPESPEIQGQTKLNRNNRRHPVRTAYHRNHLREITGPSPEELASGLPVNFIVGGFFPDVPTTKGPYHKGDAWGEGEKLHKSRYAGFRGDADPSNVSGLDDEDAYLPWLGTEWDIGGRGKGFNANRYLSRAAGAFTPRGGFRAGLSLDSYGVPVGAIASEFTEEYDENDDSPMVDFSMTGAGSGRGFNAPGLYKASRGSFGRKQGLRGSFLDGNIAQTGGFASEIGAIASEFNDAHEDEADAPMVDFSWTGAGPGRGFNRRGLYGAGKGGFVRREGFRGNYLDGNPVQVGAMQQTAEEIEDQEVRRQLKRKKAVLRSAQAFKKWAQNELIPVGDRFIDTDGNAFGYIVSLPSANDESDARAAATEIARRHNTSFTFVDRDDDWGVGEGDQVAIFSDDPTAVIVAPGEFSVSGYTSFSTTSAGIFKKVKERLESAIGSDDVEKLTNKVKRLKKQLVGAEAQLAAAKASGEAKEDAPESGRISIGRLAGSGSPFDGAGRIAVGKVDLTDLKYGWKRPQKGRDLSGYRGGAASDVKIASPQMAPLDLDEGYAEGSAKGAVAPATRATSASTLRRGDSGPRVVKLQEDLAEIMIADPDPRWPTILTDGTHVVSTLTADGDFGAQTESVVRFFQDRQNLPVDGVVGPRTQAEIQHALSIDDDEDSFNVSGLDLDDLREEAEEAHAAYKAAVKRRLATGAGPEEARQAAEVWRQAQREYESAQEDEQEGGTVIRSSGFAANPVNQAQYAMMAAGLPGLAGAVPNGGSDIGRLMDAIGATRKKKKKKTATKTRPGAKKTRPSKKQGFFAKAKAKAAAKKASRQAGKGKRKKFGQKGFLKQTGDWAKRGFKNKPGGKLGAKDMSSSSMTKTRPKGLGAMPGRAKDGSALPLATDPGMVPLVPPIDPMLPPPAEMGAPSGAPPGGGGGEMGGGGGAPPGGGGGGAPPGGDEGGGEEEDYDFGDQDEQEEDPGFQVIEFGDDEEEEQPDAQFISLDGDEEEEDEEDPESGVRVISLPRQGQRRGFGGPTMKAPGKHGRAIGVNPMGQTIYESGRIVLGSVGHSEDEDDGHYDDIYYDEDSYYDDAGLIGLSPGDEEADPQSYIDIDFGDGRSEEIETGNIDFADLVGAHPHPRLRRARAQGRGRGPRPHPKHPQTPPPRRRRPGWKKRQLGRGPR
jgi:peptidoglycan hydrolase-like protein with peptidoglycan-binding domain